MQHFIVALIFALCLYWVVRRVVRIVSRAKKGDSACASCTEVSCPLRNASSLVKKCRCDCH